MIKESLTSNEFEDVCKQIRALLNNDTVIYYESYHKTIKYKYVPLSLRRSHY